MIVKIFLREFTYIYRGEIENRKIREYIKTITKRSFIIKWKDQDDELITISQKQDIIYFYEIQQSNPIIKNTPFKLYIQEIFSDTQNYQSSSQIQIGSKLQSPQQKYFNLQQPQNYSQFLFGQSNDQMMLQKSQEIPKENNFIKQSYDLVTIEEKQDSYQNFSDKALDNKLAFSFSDKQNLQTKSLQQQQIQNETSSSHESYDIYQSLPESSFRPSINFGQFEESPKKNKFNEISKCLDIKRINEESQILSKDKIDLNQKSDILQQQEREELFGKEIFCDFCSLQIEFKDDKTILYSCEFCEDYHICSICYDDQKESVHFHQLHSI